MKIKINTNLAVNVFTICFVGIMALYFYAWSTHTSIMSFPAKQNIYNSWNNSLPPIDPEIPSSTPHDKYVTLNMQIRQARLLKNGVYMNLGGSQLGNFMGVDGGLLCDTCTIDLKTNWLDLPGTQQYYIKLPGWKIKSARFDQYNIDSVKLHVEHGQAYIRKAVFDHTITKSNGDVNYQIRMADLPVKFRYDEAQSSILIPVSKTTRDVVNIILLCLGVLLVLYIIYLISSFLKFSIDISKGLSFTQKNVNRLRLIAFSLLGYPVVMFSLNLLLALIFYSYFTGDVVMNTEAFSNWWIVMLIGIVFLQLFKAFRQGKMLKEEQDLTV